MGNYFKCAAAFFPLSLCHSRAKWLLVRVVLLQLMICVEHAFFPIDKFFDAHGTLQITPAHRIIKRRAESE